MLREAREGQPKVTKSWRRGIGQFNESSFFGSPSACVLHLVRTWIFGPSRGRNLYQVLAVNAFAKIKNPSADCQGAHSHFIHIGLEEFSLKNIS